MNTKSLCGVCSFFILLVLLSCKKEVDSLKGTYQGTARYMRFSFPGSGTPELDTLYSSVRVVVSESTDSKRKKIKIDVAAETEPAFSWKSVLVTNGNFDASKNIPGGRLSPPHYTLLKGGFKNDSLNLLLTEAEYGSYVNRWEFKTVKQ